MLFRAFAIPGPMEIVPRKFTDERGYFSEIFKLSLFEEHAGPTEFVQDNQSLSVRAGTIRGIHFQTPPAAQGKLVRCISGKVFDVVVDLRQGSPHYGKWESVILTPEQNNQVWVPIGFGHAFCTLADNSIVGYRVTHDYSPEHDKGIIWNDPGLAIEWPLVASPDTLSAKDRELPMLSHLPPHFTIES